MYYLIPVIDQDILFEDENLKYILKREMPELSKKEDQRIDIIYSTRYFMPIPKNELIEHNNKTKLMYQDKNIPMYLIAYGNNGYEAQEIVSGKKLLAKYKAALGIRRVTKEEAKKYFDENDYFNKISNYFNQIYNNELSNIQLNSEPFLEAYEIEAYLDGKLNGKAFNGEFIGTLRLTKKNC